MTHSYPAGTGGPTWEGTRALGVLLERARRVLEQNGHNLEANTTFRGDELDAVRRLIRGFKTGAPLSKSAQLSLAELDAWLARPLNGGRRLLDVLAPLRNIPVEKAEVAAYRDDAERDAIALLGHTSWLESWIDYLKQGSLTRHAATAHIRNAASVLAALPASGVTLTELVEKCTGDTKALSRTPAHGLALHALALWFDVPFGDDAATRRRLWARAGVIVDSLSSRVLVLGVRCAETNALARWLGDAADGGIPFVVNMYQLERCGVTPNAPELYVCENPAVMEAAARELGTRAAPLICTEGQPSAAVSALLTGFAGRVNWRGDFDWTGLRTTTTAVGRYGALPWRMDTATYARGLARGASEKFKDRDKECDSPWDPDLAVAMRVSGRAVMEERLIDELVDDLLR